MKGFSGQLLWFLLYLLMPIKESTYQLLSQGLLSGNYISFADHFKRKAGCLYELYAVNFHGLCPSIAYNAYPPHACIKSLPAVSRKAFGQLYEFCSP